MNLSNEYLKLEMWYFESYSELSKSVNIIDYSYAIYPKRFYKNINNGENYDYTFSEQGFVPKEVAINERDFLSKKYFY